MKDLIEQGRGDERTKLIHDMIIDGEIKIEDVIAGRFHQVDEKLQVGQESLEEEYEYHDKPTE